MIGDSLEDVQAGYNANVGRLIGIGDDLNKFRGGGHINVMKPSLLDAVKYIIESDD